MPSFYGENPPDTEVGSTDATESQISEDAVTETDTSGGFYQGSPEQTTTEAFENDARQAAEAAEAAQEAAEDAQAAAETSASNASSSESNAASSQSAAAASASNASLNAAAAAGHATTAGIKQTQASLSALAAADSASDAASSESSAASSASAAASSASSASASETSAASSAGTASTKASEAATSATNAAASESAAASSETNSFNNSAAAAGSATSAALSKTAAAVSAAAASTSASNAATSASDAASSASSASSSATAAASSASSASTSATAAGSARDAALAALDSFDDRYLGQKSSDPSLDNDGNALVAGALYFDTVNTVMKVYDGSQWLAAYASVSGALLAINNLDDVSNTATARSNLGLGTAAEQNVGYFATAAQGSLADSALQNGDNVSVLTNDSGYLTGNETITLTGDVSGSGTTSISVTIADDSHNHVISNVDGLQAALDAKQDASTALTTSNYSSTLDGRYYTETEVGTFFSGSSAITGYNKTNWDTAYGWGNHASVGYLTGNQTITLTGDVSGSGTTSIAVTIADDSHNHVISNVDGLQTALDGKTAPPTSNDTFNGTYPLVWVASDVLYSSTFMTIDGSTDTLSVPNISTGAITSTGTSTFAGIRVNNSNTALSQGAGNSLRIQTNSGYVDVGPKNTSWAHFDTDRGKFFFGQDVHVSGQIYKYDSGTTNTPYWHAGNDGSGSGLDADLLDGYHETSFVRTSAGTSSNLDSDYRAGMTSYSPSTSGTKPDTGYGQIINIVSSGSSHNNSNNWITQLAFGTGQNTSWFRSKTNSGAWGAWRTIWNDSNDGSGSGLDADLLDGLQATSFLRSDASDLFSGSYLEFQDNCVLRLGTSAEFRMWHSDDGHTYIRNYAHSAGNIYFQGEDSGGTNHALLYLRTDNAAPYVQLFYDGGEVMRTSSGGVTVYNTVNAVSGYQVNGTTVIDGSRNLTNIGSITASGTIATTGSLIVNDNASGNHYLYLKKPTSGDGHLLFQEGSGLRWQNIASSGSGAINWYSYTAGATTFQLQDSGGANLLVGDYKINGTTVIDSSRSLLNLSGTVKSDSTFNFLTGAGGAQYGKFYGVSVSSTYSIGSYGGYFNAQNGYMVGNTTIVDSSRNLTNIDQVTADDVRVTAGDGEGYGFWSSALGGAYRIYMSSSANSTYGGRVSGETTSDYNMYFKMQSGTNRGFVFRDDANNYFSINPNGIYSEAPYSDPKLYRPYITASGASSSDDQLLTRWRYADTDTYYLDLNQRATSGQLRWAFSVKNGSSTWADRLLFKNANVGIGGTQDPDYPLDVADSARFQSALFVTGRIDNPKGSHGGYSTTSGTGSGWGACIWSIGDSWAGSGTGTSYSIGTYGLHWIRSAHASEIAFADEGLYLTRANTAPYAALGRSGAYFATKLASTGEITAYYSDERLKRKTGVIENALSKVLSLEGFTYVENELARELGYNNTKEQVGVSAQAVQRVLPQAVSLAPVDYGDKVDGEIVSRSGEDYLTVDYSRLVPLLVESIKELSTEVDRLKKLLEKDNGDD